MFPFAAVIAATQIMHTARRTDEDRHREEAALRAPRLVIPEPKDRLGPPKT
jgi:hypothetical protein